MMTRREWLRMAGAGGLAAFAPRLALGADSLITRAIPSTGERLPIIGLGSSATFAQVARSDDVAALRSVMERLVALGGRVFDTAPAYGASEEVAGRIAQELGIATRLFWATKLNAARRLGSTDPAAAREQVEASFRRIGKPVIDLIQVHNMADVAVQLPVLREYQEKKRVRYIGVTTTFETLLVERPTDRGEHRAGADRHEGVGGVTAADGVGLLQEQPRQGAGGRRGRWSEVAIEDSAG